MVTSVDLPSGLGASIGSLPHRDPHEAAQFVLDRQPRLPAAPSLPRRSRVEKMIAQGAWGIAGVQVLTDGSLFIDEAAVDPGAPSSDPGIDGEPYVGMRTFLAAVAGRRAPFKLQLTGPVTLGLALAGAGVQRERAFAVAGQAVRARANALIAAARRVAPEAPLVMFVDEPGLTAAMHPGFPLGPAATIDLVSAALAEIEPHATTGVHCCGPADWKVVLEAGPQILSLPIGIGAAGHAAALAGHLERGGWIAWGSVPTHRPIGSSPELLWKRLSVEWCELVTAGCDPVLLRQRALVTPDCGLGGHALGQADLVISLTNQVARRLETQALGMRLTVGA